MNDQQRGVKLLLLHSGNHHIVPSKEIRQPPQTNVKNFTTLSHMLLVAFVFCYFFFILAFVSSVSQIWAILSLLVTIEIKNNL